MTDLDRVKGPLARLIRWVMRDATYARRYPSTVLFQDPSSGRVDLRPDDDDIRGTGLQNVPIRHGFPGASIVVPSGARVQLGFSNNDPSRPYAALWERVTPFVIITIGGIAITPAGAVIGSGGGAFSADDSGVAKTGGGAEFVALANLVLAELNAIKTAYDAHTHLHAPGPGAPVPTAVPIPLLPAPTAPASSNLKAD